MGLQSEPLHVVYGLTPGHLPMAAAAAYSMLERNPGAVDVSFLCVGLGADHKECLLNSLGRHRPAAECVDFDLAFCQGLPHGKWHPIVYAKLMIPEMFPARERSLYCDNDTVCVGAVDALRQLEFGHAVVAGVPDAGNYRDGENWIKRRDFGILEDQWYINGGVVLLNNEAWRNGGLREVLVDWMVRHHEIVTSNEQDGINGCFADRIVYLKNEYNLQVHLEEAAVFNRECRAAFRRSVEVAKIVHYTGQYKPWDACGYVFMRESFMRSAREVAAAGGFRFAAMTFSGRFRIFIDTVIEKITRPVRRARYELGEKLAGFRKVPFRHCN